MLIYRKRYKIEICLAYYVQLLGNDTLAIQQSNLLSFLTAVSWN